MNLSRCCLVILCCSLALITHADSVTGQQATDGSDVRYGFEIAASGLWSSSEGREKREDPALGLALTLGHRLKSGVVPELRTSFRQWGPAGSSELVFIPLYLGLRIDRRISPAVTISPYAGIGPSLAVGYDWGSIFAGFDGGVRLFFRIGEKVRFVAGAGYGRGMAFHPSEFGYVDVTAGLSLLP